MKFSNIIEENHIEIASLPQDLQDLIAKATSIEYDLDDDDLDDDEVKTLKSSLKALDKEICEELEEFLCEQEIEETETVAEMQARVLGEYFQDGKVKLTNQDLRDLEISVPTGSKFSLKVGKFTLSKKLYDNVVQLSR